ncbi:patatin-like phospholipase family protein [Paraburkholderia bannensis]|uniref:patatin-like phospholipase family protein n=1 Tax=Paraburkholderia bannensis TaxID=765414 RepID=UPI002AB6F604|nr:patatin-like phospholipase family protein [Paraburkholderia bannensis]
MKGNCFRILSLDGGGAWALIQVRALQKLYGTDARGHEVLKDFQLVAANSGGSLVLGGLIENLTLHEIDNLFQNPTRRSSIFSPLGGLSGFGDDVLEKVCGLGPKYSTTHKLYGIQAALPRFGTTPLDGLPRTLDNNAAWPRFLIPAFDYDLRRAMFFRSDAQSVANNMAYLGEPTVAEAIHASTNAPINYFNQPATFRSSPKYASHRYWDGAVAGYNNPVLAAVLEVLANQQRYATSVQQIVALSIGTGNTALPLPEPLVPPIQAADGGLVLHPQDSKLTADIRILSQSILSDPPDAATYAAHLALGGSGCCAPSAPVSGHVVRMNPLIRPCYSPGNWNLPPNLSATEFTDLVNLDMDAVEPRQIALINRFCDLWLADDVPNQAIRADERFQTLIGQCKFSAASAAWQSIGVTAGCGNAPTTDQAPDAGAPTAAQAQPVEATQ